MSKIIIKWSVPRSSCVSVDYLIHVFFRSYEWIEDMIGDVIGAVLGVGDGALS